SALTTFHSFVESLQSRENLSTAEPSDGHVGIESGHALETAQSLAVATKQEQNVPPIDHGRNVSGSERECMIVARQRFIISSELGKGNSAADQRTDRARVDGQSSVARCTCFLRTLECVEYACMVCKRFCGTIVDLQ